MNDITITVPDAQLIQLKEKAARLGITLFWSSQAGWSGYEIWERWRRP